MPESLGRALWNDARRGAILAFFCLGFPSAACRGRSVIGRGPAVHLRACFVRGSIAVAVCGGVVVDLGRLLVDVG